MTTTPDDNRVAITNARQHLDGCEARLAEAARERDEAQIARDALGYPEKGYTARIKLRILEAEAHLEEAAARWQECVGVHAAARAQWETLVRRAYVARELVLDRSVLTAAQALEAQLRAGLADRQATAQLLGCVDSGAHPHAHAVALVQALEYQCRQLDPPPPASPPPPRPGTVRLRCTKTFHDPDGGLGIVRRPGEIFDTREDFVRELRAQDLAVEVEG